MDFPPFRTARHDEVVAVYLSRDDLRDLDTGYLGAHIATAISKQVNESERTTFPEFESVPAYSVHDVLSGDITWEELGAQRVA